MAVLEKKTYYKVHRSYTNRSQEATPSPKERRRKQPGREAIDFTGKATFNVLSENYNSASELFENDKEFVRINHEFKTQFKAKSEYFLGLSLNDVNRKMKTSLSELLYFSPEKISLQLTNEGSLFYTFLKDGAKFYLQHYLNTANNEDEAFLNIFYSDENNENFAGELSNILQQLRYCNSNSIA